MELENALLDFEKKIKRDVASLWKKYNLAAEWSQSLDCLIKIAQIIPDRENIERQKAMILIHRVRRRL